MGTLFAIIRAFWRILRRDRFTKRLAPLHFVPLDQQLDWCFPRAAVDRPTLCGDYIDNPGQGTTQPSIVGCWNCALAIELNRGLYDPSIKANWTTEFGLTTCSTCGGIIGYPPGCRCHKSLSQWFQQLRARHDLKAVQTKLIDEQIQAERKP